MSHAYTANNTYTVNNDAFHQVVGLSDLPAGSYVVTVTLSNRQGDPADCFLSNDGGSSAVSNASDAHIDGEAGTSFTSVINSTGSGVVAAYCVAVTRITATSAEMDGSIVAIKVDAVN